jgi:hypothetical protein
MRSLAQPRVLKLAALAGAATTLACLPRLALWQTRVYPIWYLATLMFLGSIVLWAFVFAWHEQYSGRPAFTSVLPLGDVRIATWAGILGGLVLYLFVDPPLMRRSPAEYPLSVSQWLAMALFYLSFEQLFLLFAPFAWCVRLTKRTQIAAVFTVVFVVFVLLVKLHSSSAPIAAELLFVLVFARMALAALWIHLYLRGGVLLVWWFSFLVQLRHLVRLALSSYV